MLAEILTAGPGVSRHIIVLKLTASALVSDLATAVAMAVAHVHVTVAAIWSMR